MTIDYVINDNSEFPNVTLMIDDEEIIKLPLEYENDLIKLVNIMWFKLGSIKN